MRLLVCGSREWTDRAYLYGVLDGIHASQEVTAVIEGEASGADSMSRDWALGHGIGVVRFAVDWRPNGVLDRGAGIKRNAAMLRHGKPELVVAFWDGRSPGTRDMVGRSREAGLEVWIFAGPKAHGAAVPPIDVSS